MTELHTTGHASARVSAFGPHQLDRHLRVAFAAWLARRAENRADRRAERKAAGGILDVDAPRAVRRFGVPPGVFR